MVAGAAAPVYLVIQLILGSNTGQAVVRALWFLLIVFLVSLAVKWEKDAPASHPEDERPTAATPTETEDRPPPHA